MAAVNSEMKTPLLTYAETLQTLCGVDTTPGHEDALLPVLLPILTDMGAEVHLQRIDNCRTNVLARWGEPRLLFTTHMDTVAPFITPRIEGDRVIARGACDAKGQIVAQIYAIKQLLNEGAQGLAWLGVVGEETERQSCRYDRQQQGWLLLATGLARPAD